MATGSPGTLATLPTTFSCKNLLSTSAPNEIYNLAAVSRPALSWDIPIETARLNALVPQSICEFIRREMPTTRLFQASSSEIYGDSPAHLQDEETRANPRSPYGISKAYAHQIVGAYRQQYGLHLSCGILFNHESPRRPLGFVSQKIAHAAAAASLGLTETRELDERGKPILSDGKLYLGDINVRRDFGFAGDVVEAMRLIVQSDVPSDFVVGTGHAHSIAEFCEVAFRVGGLDWTTVRRCRSIAAAQGRQPLHAGGFLKASVRARLATESRFSGPGRYDGAGENSHLETLDWHRQMQAASRIRTRGTDRTRQLDCQTLKSYCMNIGFDISQTGSGKAGCGYYTHAMIKAMLAIAPQHRYALYPSFGDFYFDARMPVSNPYRGEHVSYGPRHLTRETARAFWNQAELEVALGHPDIIHSNNFWTPVQIASSRLIYTLYDMGFAVNPDLDHRGQPDRLFRRRISLVRSGGLGGGDFGILPRALSEAFPAFPERSRARRLSLLPL